MPPDVEAVAEQVFIALADSTRRAILAALASGGPATATDLAGRLPITRQAVAKHLAVLEDANLVAVIWRGREKLHYLNPVPINEIGERWIGKFERHRMQALSDMKKALEASNE